MKVKLSKQPKRLPPISNPRGELKFRFRSYRDLMAGSGHYDALAAFLSLSVRYFLNAGEEYAKENYSPNSENSESDEVVANENRNLIWTFNKSEAERFSVYAANVNPDELMPHTAKLLLVSAYQQAESFLNGIRLEHREMGIHWPAREDQTPLLEYTLENLPRKLRENKVRIGEERFELFEYYRLMRNAFVHGPTASSKLQKLYDAVALRRELVATEYKLNAPNPFGALTLDDYMLFTRLIKYIATDICRIGEPSDEALIALISPKNGRLGSPLRGLLKYRTSQKHLQLQTCKWFKNNYSINLESRPTALAALLEYIEKFPNRSMRKKEVSITNRNFSKAAVRKSNFKLP